MIISCTLLNSFEIVQEQLDNVFVSIKYVGVQSWKAAHLPILEIRVKQKGNHVMKVEPYWEKNKNKKNSAKKNNVKKN